MGFCTNCYLTPGRCLSTAGASHQPVVCIQLSFEPPVLLLILCSTEQLCFVLSIRSCPLRISPLRPLRRGSSKLDIEFPLWLLALVPFTRTLLFQYQFQLISKRRGRAALREELPFPCSHWDDSDLWRSPLLHQLSSIQWFTSSTSCSWSCEEAAGSKKCEDGVIG